MTKLFILKRNQVLLLC